MARASLLKPRSQPGAAVAMTRAQIERQDLQVAWLRAAIAAQERRSIMRLDLDSLRLPRPEALPCAA